MLIKLDLTSGSGNTHRENSYHIYNKTGLAHQQSIKTETLSSESSYDLTVYNSKPGKIRNLHNYISSNEINFEESFLSFIEKSACLALPPFIKFFSELLNEPEMRTIFLLISSDDLTKIFNDLSKIRIIRRFTYDIFIKVNINTKEGLKLWNFKKYIVENNCLEGILSAIKSNYFTSSYEDLDEIFRELINLLIICSAFYETQKDFKNEIFNFLYKIFEDLLISSDGDEIINDDNFFSTMKNFISEIFYLSYIDKDDLKPKLHENMLNSLESTKSLVIHNNNFKDYDVLEFMLTLFSSISDVLKMNVNQNLNKNSSANNLSNNNNNLPANNKDLNANSLYQNISNVNINLYSNMANTSHNNNNSKSCKKNISQKSLNYNIDKRTNALEISNFNNISSNFNNTKLANNTTDITTAPSGFNQSNIANNSNIYNKKSCTLFEKTEYIRKVILTFLLDNDLNLNKYKNLINNTNYCKLILENLHSYSEEMISYPFNSIIIIISDMGISGSNLDNQAATLSYSPEKEIKSILKNLTISEDEAKINIILKHFKLFFDFYQANFQKLFISCGFLGILKDVFDQTIYVSRINCDNALIFNNINYYSDDNSSNGRSKNSTPLKFFNSNKSNNLNVANNNSIKQILSFKDNKDLRNAASPHLLIKLIEFLEIILHNNFENIQKYKSLLFLDNYFEVLTQFSDYKSVAYKIWNLTINFENDDHEIIKYTKFLSKRYQILKETVLSLTMENSHQIKSLLEEIYTINEIIHLCYKNDNLNKIISNVQLNIQFLKAIFLDFFDLIILIKTKVSLKDNLNNINSLNLNQNLANTIINSGILPSNIGYNCSSNIFNNAKIPCSNPNAISNNIEKLASEQAQNIYSKENVNNPNNIFNINNNVNLLLINKDKEEFFDTDIHYLIKNYIKLFLGMILKFNQLIFSLEFKTQKNSIPEGNLSRKFDNMIKKKDCKEIFRKILIFYNSLSDKRFLTDILFFLCENSLKITIIEKKAAIDKRNHSISAEKLQRQISFVDETNKLKDDFYGDNDLSEDLTNTFKKRYKLEDFELNSVYTNISNYSNFILQSPFIIKIILKTIVRDMSNLKFLYDFTDFIYLLCQVNENNIKLLLKARIIKPLLFILDEEYFSKSISNKNNINGETANPNNHIINNNNLNKQNNSNNVGPRTVNSNNENEGFNFDINKITNNNNNNFISDENDLNLNINNIVTANKQLTEQPDLSLKIQYISLDLIKTTLISKIIEIIELSGKFFDKKDIELMMEHLYIGFCKKKADYNILERIIICLKKNLKSAKKNNKAIILSPLVTRQPNFFNILFTSNVKFCQDKNSKESNNSKNKFSSFSIFLSLKFHRNFENNTIFSLFKIEREIKDKDYCMLEAYIENGILKIKENDIQKTYCNEDLNLLLEKTYNFAFLITKENSTNYTNNSNLVEIFLNEKLISVCSPEFKNLDLNQAYNLSTGYSCSTTREANYDEFGYIPHISFNYFLIYNEKLTTENLNLFKLSKIYSGKSGSAASYLIKRRGLSKRLYKILASSHRHQKEKLKYICLGIEPKKVALEIIPDKISFYTNNEIMKYKTEQSFCNNFIFKIQRKFFLDITEKDLLAFIPNTNIANEDKSVFNNTYLLTKINESEIIHFNQMYENATIKNKVQEKIFNINTLLDVEIYSTNFFQNFFAVLFECKDNLCFNSLLALLNAYLVGNIGEMIEFCDSKYLAILSAMLYKKNLEYKSLIEADNEDNDDNIEELDEEIQKIFSNKSDGSSLDEDNHNNNSQNNQGSSILSFKKNSGILDLQPLQELNINTQINIENKRETVNLNNFNIDNKIQSKNQSINNMSNHAQSIRKSLQNIYKDSPETRDSLNVPFNTGNNNPNNLNNINNFYNFPNNLKLNKEYENMNLQELEKEKTELLEKINKRRQSADNNKNTKTDIAALLMETQDEDPDLKRVIEISNRLDNYYTTNAINSVNLKEDDEDKIRQSNYLLKNCNLNRESIINDNAAAMYNLNNNSFYNMQNLNNNNNLNISSGQINSIKEISLNKNLYLSINNPNTFHNNVNNNMNINSQRNNILNNSSLSIIHAHGHRNISLNQEQLMKRVIVDCTTIDILLNMAFGTENFHDLHINIFNPLFPKIITEVIYDLNFFRKLEDKVKIYIIEKTMNFFNQMDYIFIYNEVNFEIKVNILVKMFKILMIIPHQEEVDQFAISLIIILLEQIMKFKKGELEPTENQLKTVINSTQEFILIAGYFNDIITSHLKYRDFDQIQLDNTSDVIKNIFKKLFEEKIKVAREIILATFTKIWEDLNLSNFKKDNDENFSKSHKHRHELRKSTLTCSGGVNKMQNLLNPSFFLKLYNKEINNKANNRNSISKAQTAVKLDSDRTKKESSSNRNRSSNKKGEVESKDKEKNKSVSKAKAFDKEKEMPRRSITNLNNTTFFQVNQNYNNKDKSNIPSNKNSLLEAPLTLINIDLTNNKSVNLDFYKKSLAFDEGKKYEFQEFGPHHKASIGDENLKNQMQNNFRNINNTSNLNSNLNNSIFIYESPMTNPNYNSSNLYPNAYPPNANSNLNNNNNLQKLDCIDPLYVSGEGYNKQNKTSNNNPENYNYDAQNLNNLINNSNLINSNIMNEFEESMIEYSELQNNNNNYLYNNNAFDEANDHNLDLEGECQGADCRLCSLISNLQHIYFNLVLKIQESKKMLKKYLYYQFLKHNNNNNSKILEEKQIEFSYYIFNHEGPARIRNRLIAKMDAIKNEELNKKYYGNGNVNSEEYQKKLIDYRLQNVEKKSNFEKIFTCFKIKKFVSQICYLDQIFKLNFIKNLINKNDEFIAAYNCLIIEECHHIDAILVLGKNQFYILSNLHLDREGYLAYSKDKFRKTFWILNDYTDDWDAACPYLRSERKPKKNLISRTKDTKKLKPKENVKSRISTLDDKKMEKFSKLRKGFKFISFNYDRINEIFKRRFLLKHNSLEIFLKTGKNFYLCFNLDKREAIFLQFVEGIFRSRKLECNNSSSSSSAIKLSNINLSTSQLNSPFCYFSRNMKIILKKSKGKLNKNHKMIVDYKQVLEEVQDYWEKGVISNFNYLMILNTLAGRSYNDISQYIVMPWTIKDYISEGLNLNNYDTYRDLSRPIHAIDDNTYKNLSIKYSEADEFDKFHSGSHYSSPGFVCYFLIRLKPFSYISSEIQGGYFDIADRLFNNIKSLWDVSDKYQELIPEMYYLPEAFVNYNEFDFGTNQNSMDVNDVNLPCWSKNDPRLFVKMNKKALESSKVSEKLSDWIDLIFGLKQTGKDAIKALNVFRPLCYEGKIDFTKLDERDQDDKIVEIHDFGQVPIQIFNKSHNRKEKHLKSFAFFSSLHNLILFKEKEKSVTIQLENAPENLRFYSECENYLSCGQGGITSFLSYYDVEEKSSKFNDASNTLVITGHKKYLIGPKYCSYVDYSFNKYSFAFVFPLSKISFVFNTFRTAALTTLKTTFDGKRLILAFADGVIKVYRIIYEKKDRIFHPDYEKKKDKGFFGLFGGKKENKQDNNTNTEKIINNNSNYNIYNNNYNFGNPNMNNNITYNNPINPLNINNGISLTNYNYNNNFSTVNNNLGIINNNTINNINNLNYINSNTNVNNNQYSITQTSVVTGVSSSFVEIIPGFSEKELLEHLSYECFNNKIITQEKMLYPIYKFNSSISEFKDFFIYYNNCNHELSKNISKGAKKVSLKFIKENKIFQNEIKLLEICESYSLLIAVDISNQLYICDLNKLEVLKLLSLNKIFPKLNDILQISIDGSSGDFIIVSSLYVILFNINGVILAVLDLKDHPKISKITTALIKSVLKFC